MQRVASKEEEDEIIAENRHRELSYTLKSIAKGLVPKDDTAIVNAIKGQCDEFKNAIGDLLNKLPEQKEPKVNVNIDYENLLTSVREISDKTILKIEESKNEIIQAFENRLLPDTFELVKNFGVTQSVKVNYKPANLISVKK